jgi:hypothetical protein
VPLEQLAGRLKLNYIDKCRSICALAPLCKARVRSRAQVLGDAAASLLGADTELRRTVELLKGAPPATPGEVELAGRLVEALSILEPQDTL